MGADPGTDATFAEPGSYGSNEAGDDTYSTGVDGDANETGASGDAGNNASRNDPGTDPGNEKG